MLQQRLVRTPACVQRATRCAGAAGNSASKPAPLAARDSAALVLVGVLALVASAAAQAPAPTGLAVTVARPMKRCFDDRVDVTGVLVPRQEFEVRPDREGLTIVQVLAEPLEEVKAGQALAQLAPGAGEAGGATVVIRAPVAGIVGRSTAVVGATASAQAEALFQIVADGEIELAAGVPITRLGGIKLGQPVLVKPLGASGVPGQVRVVSATADPATQRGQVRVFVGRNAHLPLGLFARGTISVAQRCGIAVPFSSLLSGPEGMAVYVAYANKVEARPVTTGLSTESEIEIRSGLGEGDLVVLRAGPFLREGDLVRPVTSNGAPPN